MKVLIVEDELKMASLLLRGFRKNGDAVDVTRKGEDAVWMAAAADYDAIVLDVMLPGMDGFETLAALREQANWTPVLMLTARDAIGAFASLSGHADSADYGVGRVGDLQGIERPA